MSMTREEAIKFAEHAVNMTDIPDVKEFYGLAAAALRGPTREMVERMRGEWISTGAISCKCSKCNHLEPKYRVNEYNFCPYCMAAMTDEAVDMMLEKLEALHEKAD